MFYILVMVLCTIVALLVLLDFFVNNFTTYRLAKSSQGPPMYPIIGSTQFLFSSQGRCVWLNNFMMNLINLYFLKRTHSNWERVYVGNIPMDLCIGLLELWYITSTRPNHLRYNMFDTCWNIEKKTFVLNSFIVEK